MINFRFIFFALTPICLLSIMGCSGINGTNEKADNDSEAKEVSNNEKLEVSSGDTIPKPPSLTVYVEEETIRPSLGTYSWSVDNGDGIVNGIESDSFAPPELVKDSNPMQVTSNTNVELDFEEQPESYTVRIWGDDNNVVNTSDEVVLSDKGKIVYEVLAHWEQGTASYAFSLDVE
ncbi:hypothetical protein [Halobacillus aidingensis]|uniref:Uncharacterized protein n=1 Tax=Halobacillus aidingensis TaxID=240303 RepID=A0A1H0UDV0_HALAD|nr:hypothetical protein [Halobacillus aidingensis]SDP64195.1 hypothetical protein SAMN05421677_12552 [Halobacillus aidingensis]